MGGNLAMAIFMSRFPPILWHKHATTKSGGPVVQHSYAMNTHVCSIPFCNCMFALDKGWNSWLYSSTLVWCQTGGGNLAIFMYCWLDSGKICMVVLQWNPT